MLDNKLLTFLELCKTKSFTKTAENLHMTQPAVSQQIRFLENYYGTKIYQYSNRRFSLTLAGEYLYNFVVSINADSELLREKLKSDSLDMREIKFGAEVTAGESFMPKALARFIKQFPSYRVLMKIHDTDQLQQMLRTGELDFLVIDDTFLKSECEYYTLCRSTTVCVCSPDHPLAGQEVTFEDLFREPLIVRSKGSPAYNNLDQILQKSGVRLIQFNNAIEIDNANAAKQFIKQDVGITFFYQCMVDDELHDKTLSRIYIKDFAPVHNYSFVVMKNSFFKNEHFLFFDFCKNYLQTYEQQTALTL